MAERRRPPLHCFWGDLHVAEITQTRPWDLRLRYTEEAQERWATNSPVLSCSLPVQRRPLRASAFLRGLLPEGRHLDSVARMAGVVTNDLYGLLARYGRDVAGALVISSDEHSGDSRSQWSVEPYTEESLADEVAGLEERSLGVHADSELSLAGLQNKLLLVKLDDDVWGRPVRGHPSTHILKVDDDRYPGLVAAEADCLRLAAAAGLADVEVGLIEIAGRRCIIVERYDRAGQDGTVERLHQEDACQALGVDPQEARGRAKYESAGGPALAQVAELLRAHSRDPSAELEALVRLTAFNLAIGNADAHGKNISLMHDMDGYIRLAPAYDVVPTMLWPNLRDAMAMSVNGRWRYEQITRDDFAAEARTWGLQSQNAANASVNLWESLPDVVSKTVTNDHLAQRISERCGDLLNRSKQL